MPWRILKNGKSTQEHEGRAYFKSPEVPETIYATKEDAELVVTVSEAVWEESGYQFTIEEVAQE